MNLKLKLTSAALVCCWVASTSLASDNEPLNIKGITPGMPKVKVAQTLGTNEIRCAVENVIEYCSYAVSFAGVDQTMIVEVWNGTVIRAEFRNVANLGAVKLALSNKYGVPALEQVFDTAWLENGILLRIQEREDSVSISNNEMLKKAYEEEVSPALNDI